MTDRICSVQDCSKPAKVRDWCRTHYMQWYRSPAGQSTEKTMGRPPEAPKPCQVDRCDRPAVSRGWCLMHWKRNARTGKATGLTAADRFFRHVTESPDGCWLWDKPGTNGYGQYMVGRKPMGAHRWAYEYMVADIPEGLTIDHLCRNRACVNPAHLEPVPIAVNIQRAAPHRVRS